MKSSSASSGVLGTAFGVFLFLAALSVVTPIVYLGVVNHPNDHGGTLPACNELYRFCIFLLAAYIALACAGLLRLMCNCFNYCNREAFSWVTFIMFLLLGPVMVLAGFFYAIVILDGYNNHNYSVCGYSTYYFELARYMAWVALAVPLIFTAIFATVLGVQYCLANSKAVTLSEAPADVDRSVLVYVPVVQEDTRHGTF